VGRILRFNRVAKNRPGESVRGVEVALGKARECRGPTFGSSIRDGASICHGYLERLTHDDMTTWACKTFIAAHTGPLRSPRRVSTYPRSVTLDRSIAPRCNIGPEEIARRRRSALVATIMTALVAVALVALSAPPAVRLLIWPLATAAAVTWLQVVNRFCVAFGALGLENFGRLGDEVHVDRHQRSADRRRALQLILEGALIGLVVALLLVAIPV
jgi:hypothetical protein